MKKQLQKLIQLGLFLLITDAVFAQCYIAFNKFVAAIIVTAANKEHAFFNFNDMGEPLENFVSTNGSPSITTIAGAPSGNQVAVLAVCSQNNSEGLAYSFNFQANHTYHLKFYYRYSNLGGNNQHSIEDVGVFLTNGLTEIDVSPCSGTPNIGNAQNIFSRTNFSDTDWVQADICFTPDSDYAQLWFRVNNPTVDSSSGFLLLDDFCLNSCCNSSTQAFISVGDSIPQSLCLGSTIVIRHGGGPYGSFFSVDADEVYIDSIPLDSSGHYVKFDTVTIDGGLGTQHICYVSYSAHPDSTENFCSDTLCFDLTTRLCQCENITPELRREEIAAGTYAYEDTSEIEATVYTWRVNDSIVRQTTYEEDFVFTPDTAGVYEICMEAMYVRPVGNGNSECCFTTVCDTVVFEDNCDYWRATDSVTYMLNSNNPREVTFNFHGRVPYSVTWDFGDSEEPVVNNGDSVKHTYNTEGQYNVCAYIIWTKPEHENCCCVDTICIPVDATPCGLVDFSVILNMPLSSPELGYTFNLNPIYSGFTPIGYDTVYWDFPIEGSGLFTEAYHPEFSGFYNICANVEYHIGEAQCSERVCGVYYLEANAPENLMRIFPNPATDKVMTEVYNFTNEKSASVLVTDIIGRPFFVKELTDLREGVNLVLIDISKFPQGVYAVTLKIGDTHEVDKLIRK